MRQLSPLLAVCGALWIMASASARTLPEWPAGPEDPKSGAVRVTAPDTALPTGAEAAPILCRFENPTPEEFRVVARQIFWHSLAGGWQSVPARSDPLDVLLTGFSHLDWKGTAAISGELLRQAREAGGIEQEQLLLVQVFTLRSRSGAISHVTCSLILRLEPPTAAIEQLSIAHHQVTVLTALRGDPARKAQLARFLTFADASYEKLASILGFKPNRGRLVPLRITTYGGFPHYQSGGDAGLRIPCELLEGQSSSDWLFVVYPHELTHYFLLEEFPHPPRWFIEGPASFFGAKVAEALGYADSVRRERVKISAWADDYARDKCSFLFSDQWPDAPETPGLTYARGLGRGYERCALL